MELFEKFCSFIIKIRDKIAVFLHSRIEWKNIKNKKNLINKVNLTKEQEKQIDKFFIEHYGKKINKSWHKLYQSYTGEFHFDYFPEILYSTKLEKKLNDTTVAEVLTDKNILEKLISNVKNVRAPKTYAQCINGRYLINGQFCQQEDIYKKIKNISCVIKKTVDTNSGRDVEICDFENGVNKKNGEYAFDIFNKFGKNFVVQEKIIQHERLANINNTGVNTFRIMSYIYEGKVYLSPTVLRLCTGGRDKDNMHYNGIAVAVKDDNKLNSLAFSEYGKKYEKHPDSGVIFADYELPFMDSVRQAAKNIHSQMLWLGVLSYDMTVDANGQIVLIEINALGQSSWMPQMICGKPLFGEHTAYMLELIKKK